MGQARLHFILMGNIRRSSTLSPPPLLRAFNTLVREANSLYSKSILSPLTITLGDEFQGVVSSLRSGLDILLFLEERRLSLKPEFQPRLVLHRGLISTRLNRVRAHGMLGSGLAAAREQLEGLKAGRRRLHVSTGLPQDAPLDATLFLLEELTAEWRRAGQRSIASHFLAGKDYRQVAKLLHRHSTSALRRRRTLRIEPYSKLKEIAQWLADPPAGLTLSPSS